jgi:hypothetical protein
MMCNKSEKCKVKSPFAELIEHCVINLYAGVETQLHACLTLADDDREGSAL